MKKRKRIQPDLETLVPILIKEWRLLLEFPGPDDVLQTREFRSVVQSLKEMDINPVLPDFFDNKNILGTYLLYQWIIHYQEALALLGELPSAPRRVWDVCSGPLPMAFAALRHGAEDVVATDDHLQALLLGAAVSGRYGHPVRVRRWNCFHGRPPVDGLFDLIILGHCLRELFPSTQKGWEEAQEAFIMRLMTHLTPDGHILIVDGSFPEENRRVLELRDRLVKKGIPIQAPCVWQGECPAIAGKHHPCYAQREMEKPYHIKELQRAAGINASSLKMSYLLLGHSGSSWPAAQEGWYRVISPPVDASQGKMYYLCGVDGYRTLESRLKEQTDQAKAFAFLKRGELISVRDAVCAKKQLIIDAETEVRVVAALNKPINS